MSHQETLLNGGRGIDHVVIAVRSLDSARSTYQQLGFAIQAGGKHPGGTENIVIYFADDTYLEPLSFYDRSQASWLASILEQREGPIMLGVDVASAEQTAHFLQSRGYPVNGPFGGTIALPDGPRDVPELWKMVSFSQEAPLSAAIFFIEYHRNILQELARKYISFDFKRYTDHPNTSKRVAAVWIAVSDLDAALQVYKSLGLMPNKQCSSPALNVNGSEIIVGNGTILLLQMETFKSSQQGREGIIGVSIEVSDLGVAQTFTQQVDSIAIYNGLYGKSICIPPALTHGLWVELFEQ